MNYIKQVLTSNKGLTSNVIGHLEPAYQLIKSTNGTERLFTERD